jgi:putative nucleotidyltransferase with HDIG domain
MKTNSGMIKVVMLPFMARQPVGGKEQIVYQPMVPVRLRAGRFQFQAYALIDTGAEMCSINRKVIEKEASVDLADKLVLLAGPRGIEHTPIFRFELDVCKPGFETSHTLRQVNFAAVELPSGCDVVLGRNALQNTKLTIDYQKRRLTIEFPKEEVAVEKPTYLIEARSLIESGNYNAGVVAASTVIERSLMDIAQNIGILPEQIQPMTLKMAAEALLSEGFLDKQSITVLWDFSELRNRSVHGLKPLTASEAQHALALAKQIMNLLEAKKKERRSLSSLSHAISFSEMDMVIEYTDNLNNSANKERAELFTRAMECKERELYQDASTFLLKALDTGASGSERIALLVLLGTTRLREDKLDEAMDLYSKAAADADEAQDRLGLTAALGNMGIARKLANDLTEAQMYLEKAIILCEQIGFVRGKANLLTNLANINLSMGRQKAAHTYFKAATALVEAIEKRDRFVSRHSIRVANLAKKIGRQLGLTPEEVNLVHRAALLHDIGLIAIPERVLQKKGALTESEFTQIMSHAALSAEIVGKFEEFKEVVPIIRSHHEHYDGSGYPKGLKGDEIPLGARILALADSYVAMTSPRPYRHPFSIEEAEEELLRHSDSSFDPKVVRAFASLSSRDKKLS